MSADPTRHVYTHPSPVEHWRHLIEIVALVVAALWGAYVFIYQERIKPAAEPANLDFTMHVEHQNLIHNKELVVIQPTWHNIGSVQAQVDGFIVNVYGMTYAAGTGKLSPVSLAATARGFVPPSVRSRAMQERRSLILTVFNPWRPLGGQYFGKVDPGDTLAPKVSFAIPRGIYEAIVIAENFCYRRLDDTRSLKFVPSYDASGAASVSASLADAERKAFGSTNFGSCQINTRLIYAL